MSFTISQPKFKKLLTNLNKVISKKTSLPSVLNYAEVVLCPNKAQFTVTDLNMSYSTTVPVESDVFETFLLPIKTILDRVKTAPKDSNITISVIDAHILSISYSGVSSRIETIHLSEWPPLTTRNQHSAFEIDTQILIDTLNKALVTAHKIDTRPVLYSIWFKHHDNGLEVVSSDGYRMSYQKIDIPSFLSFKLLVNSDLISKWLKVVGKKIKGKTLVEISDTQMIFNQENSRTVFGLTEDKIPELDHLIKQVSDVTIEVNREVFLTSVEMLLAFNKYIKLDYDKNCFSVKAASPEEQHSIIVDIVGSTSGFSQNITIRLNTNYLVEALKSFNSPTVFMDFSTEHMRKYSMPFKVYSNDSDLVVILPEVVM